jgi:hypothetical protein
MKILVLLFCTSAAGGAWLAFAPCSPLNGRCSADTGAVLTESPSVRGRYVEVRDASVYAGACHVNGESELRGRRAIAAWSIESGEHQGVALDGVELVAAVESDDNLARAGARRSVVYVAETLEPARRDAALAWLRASQSALLGEIGAVEAAQLDVSLDGDRFAIAAGDDVEAAGSAFADRRCCSMPALVAYEPLALVEESVCGSTTSARFAGSAGMTAWSWPEQNNAILGDFRCVTMPQALSECCTLPIRSPAAAPSGIE